MLQLGHGARNCNRPARCVKCIGFHSTSACPRQSRYDKVQCTLVHPANYKGCSYLKEQAKLKTPSYQHNSATPNLSYSQAVSQSTLQQSSSNFEQLTIELNELNQLCDLTSLLLMVREIKSKIQPDMDKLTQLQIVQFPNASTSSHSTEKSKVIVKLNLVTLLVHCSNKR